MYYSVNSFAMPDQHKDSCNQYTYKFYRVSMYKIYRWNCKRRNDNRTQRKPSGK